MLPCENSSTAVCEPCGVRYRRRVQVVALEGCGVDVATVAEALDGDQDEAEALGLLHLAQGVFTVLVLTLTAPGNSRHRDRTRPGAPWCECTDVGGVDLAVWNGQQGDRWNRFIQDLRRHRLLGEIVQYFRAVEVQDGKRRLDGRGRQALHEHVLLRLDGVVQLDAALVDQLRRLAIAHGYGHELVVETPVISQDGRARLAAWYAAKYVSKATDVRGVVPWQRRHLGERLVDVVDERTGEVTRESRPRLSPSTYRTWTASRGWGCSMRLVKQRQREWAALTAHDLPHRDSEPAALTSIGQPADPVPDG